MSWAPGDQAMCVRRFPQLVKPVADYRAVPGGLPTPPLVYIVAAVRPTPEPPPGQKWRQPAPACFLVLEGKGAFMFAAEHFRKLEPLSPGEIDLPIWAPTPEPETV